MAGGRGKVVETPPFDESQFETIVVLMGFGRHFLGDMGLSWAELDYLQSGVQTNKGAHPPDVRRKEVSAPSFFCGFESFEKSQLKFQSPLVILIRISI